MNTIRIGLIGCGNISEIYFQNLTSGRWPWVNLVACADLDVEQAQQAVNKYPTIQARDVDALIKAPDVDLILNLTIPKAHFPIAMQCIEEGKHHYSEKPLALTVNDANTILESARKHGVKVGCAPDTFLGAGIQTAIHAIREKTIGRVVHISGQFLCRGHERWHPSPEFYYQPGGGPLHDMGPYYLTAMVAMLGPVKSVSGFCRETFPTRVILSGPKTGNEIKVETPTHITALLEFESGTTGTLVTSFDAESANLPSIFAHGTDGCLFIPDPNGFGGNVELFHGNNSSVENTSLPHVNQESQNSRGLGIADMARGIQQNKPFRATASLAAHVLEIIEKIHQSSHSGQHQSLTTSPQIPAPWGN